MPSEDREKRILTKKNLRLKPGRRVMRKQRVSMFIRGIQTKLERRKSRRREETKKPRIIGSSKAYLVSQLSECLYLSAESIPRGFSRAHVAGKPRAGGGAPKIASPCPISGRWSAACERRLWGVSPRSGPKPSGWHPKPTSGEK